MTLLWKLFRLGDIALDKGDLHFEFWVNLFHLSFLKSTLFDTKSFQSHLLGAKLFSHLCQCGKPPLLPHIRDAHSARMKPIFAPRFKMFLLCPCSKETNSKSFSKTLRGARHKADSILNLCGFQRFSKVNFSDSNTAWKSKAPACRCKKWVFH